jgi:dUTP pyrophosphatase
MDYRVWIKIILFNHGKEDFIINNKDRVAQMILTPAIKMELEETDNLPVTLRSEGGFGSTGK